MFQQVLREVVDNTDGGVASLLMGFDGIPVDQYLRDGTDVDIESVGMEYSVILRSVMHAADMLESGKAKEFAVRAERLVTIVRLLNDDYFVAIALSPGGNVGKARFLLRTRSPKLLADLE
ncbi:MAG: hypothetical protein AAF447_24850 [Myxococcota bacterium]